MNLDCISIAVACDDSQYAVVLANALAKSAPGHRLVLGVNAMAQPAVDTLRDQLTAIPNITVLVCHHKGNTGWAHAVENAWQQIKQGKIGASHQTSAIALWHDDMLPCRNWQDGLKALNDPKVGLVSLATVPLVAIDLEVGVEAIDTFWEIVEFCKKEPGEARDGFVEAPYLVKVSALNGEPLLDPAFGPCGYADWDLFERLLQRNYKLHRELQLPCYHWHRKLWTAYIPPETLQTSREQYLKKWQATGRWWKMIEATRKEWITT